MLTLTDGRLYRAFVKSRCCVAVRRREQYYNRFATKGIQMLIILANVNSVMIILFGCVLFATVLVHVHGQTNGPDMDPIMNPATCATTYCPPNSTCVQTSSYVYCDCVPGKTGINCTMDDPCLETNVNCPRGMKCFGPCNPNVFCQGATGIPQCTNCISGFKGTNCDEDEDECKEWKDVCKSNGKCTNTFGGYRCDCKVGYSGENCEICKLSEAECNENGRHSEEDASKKTESAAESFHIVNVSIPLTLTCIMSLWI